VFVLDNVLLENMLTKLAPINASLAIIHVKPVMGLLIMTACPVVDIYYLIYHKILVYFHVQMVLMRIILIIDV